MIGRVLVILGAAILLAASAFAQESTPPDLTGTWTLNLTKSKAAKGQTLHAARVEIESGGSDVSITETIDGKDTTNAYFTDGKATPIARVRGGQIMAKAYWKKSKLVIETFGVQSAPNPSAAPAIPRTVEAPSADSATYTNSVERWSVSPDGSTLTREFENPKQTFVYDKQ